MFNVLVVEDEEVVRRGIVQTIDWAALHCQVVGEASNGEEGAQLAASLSPDLIVTDLKMPRMDGVEMIAHLRAEGSRAHVIILSAYGDFKYAQSALRLGVNDYLLKPLKDGELETAVQALSDRMEKLAAEYEERLEKKREEKRYELRLEKAEHVKNRYLAAAIRFIENHYREDITISTVAENLEISEGYLSRMFKKETGDTFTGYLTSYRMNRAMELLKNCRMKVYEVADRVGYSDTAYFSTQFKKVVGIAPSEYPNHCRT